MGADKFYQLVLTARALSEKLLATSRAHPHRLRLVGAICIAVYALIYSTVYTSVSITPDDHMFLDHAQSIVPHIEQVGYWPWFLTQDNRLAYGAAYWLLYASICRFTPQAFWVMRALSFVAAVSVPVSFLTMGRTRRPEDQLKALLAALLWLTFPCAWWIGKVTGPEIFVVACVALCCRQFTRDGMNSFWGWLCVGIAFGIKTTAAPVGLFFGLRVLFEVDRPIMRLARAACVCATGFLLTNPFVLANPQQFLTVSRQYSRFARPADPTATVRYLLDNGMWLWDSVPSCGLTQWSLAPLSALMFVGLLKAARLKASVGVAAASTMICVLVLLTCNQIYLGWYWFPTVALMPALLAAGTRLTGAIAAGCLLLIGVNGWEQAPFIKENLRHNADHQRLLLQRHEMQRCIEEKTPPGLNIETVLDRSDLDTAYNFSFLTPETGRKLNYFSPRDLEGRDVSADRSSYVISGPTLMLVGERFARRKAFANFAVYMPEFFPTCRNMKKLYRCGSLDVFLLQCGPH